MDQPTASIWERLDRPVEVPKTTLSHDQIAKAAIEIADAEGLDNVSMRRLAAQLKVSPMAAYRYVAGKDDIFELMIDGAFACDLPDAEGGDWRSVMRGVAEVTRAVVMRHPWLVQAAARTPIELTPNRLALAEQALASIDGLGIDIDMMMGIYRTVTTYAWGATAADVSITQLMQREGWDEAEDLRSAYLPHMSWHMSTGKYPTYSRYCAETVRKDDDRGQFDFGLDCLLDGIEARLGLA